MAAKPSAAGVRGQQPTAAGRTAKMTASASSGSGLGTGPQTAGTLTVGRRQLSCGDRGRSVRRVPPGRRAGYRPGRGRPPSSPAKTGPEALVPAVCWRAEAGNHPADPLEQRRCDGLEGQLTGLTRVNATEQRLQQPVGDLSTEPIVDQVPIPTSPVSAGAGRSGSRRPAADLRR